MKHVVSLLIAIAILTSAIAQEVKHGLPYTKNADKLQILDLYSPPKFSVKNRPVVFWIHGGGWQTGDKSDVYIKPQVFNAKGFVFVSTNYRLLPDVDMATLVRDVAKSIRWVHDHVAEHGGDPKRLLIMGHSAGAQLAALLCTDDRYLKAEGLSLGIIKGCVPVDGDTYDIPAMIEVAETRWRVHGLTPAKFSHRIKFGNDPAKHKDFSAVTHVASDKGIPPFLILYVANHPDTSAQAQRLGNVLKEAGVPVTIFGAKETTHTKINADLGRPDDPATTALFEFVENAVGQEVKKGQRTAKPHNFARWEKSIAAFEAADRVSPPPKGAVLFVGASTITLWKTLARDFPDHKVINRGFGGSEIVDTTHFAERIIFPYDPKMIVLRCGSNDIFNGKRPEDVLIDFKAFVSKIREKLPRTEIVFMSLNAIPSRWTQKEKDDAANKLIRTAIEKMANVRFLDISDMVLTADGKSRTELFGPDRLHFNKAGYKLLAERVRAILPPAGK
jgi:arylformamidase